MRRLILTLPVLLLLGAQPGLAHDHGGDQYRHPRIDDRVMLELTVSDWVETETAKVSVGIDLAVAAGGFGQARAEAFRDLQAIADTAPWRIVEHHKLDDEAGFERWHLVAEARLPDRGLADLPRRVEAASKPGRDFSLSRLDYSPSLAERQAVAAALRQRIYELAGAEAAALNAAYAGRAYRVARVNFLLFPDRHERERGVIRSMAAKVAEAVSMPGITAAHRITVTARVVLAAALPDG